LRVLRVLHLAQREVAHAIFMQRKHEADWSRHADPIGCNCRSPELVDCGFPLRMTRPWHRTNVVEARRARPQARHDRTSPIPFTVLNVSAHHRKS